MKYDFTTVFRPKGKGFHRRRAIYVRLDDMAGEDKRRV